MTEEFIPVAQMAELANSQQFKVAASLIATIPPHFFIDTINYCEKIIQEFKEGDDKTKNTHEIMKELYSAALVVHSRYRKLMREEEKERKQVEEEQASKRERRDTEGDEKTPKMEQEEKDDKKTTEKETKGGGKKGGEKTKKDGP